MAINKTNVFKKAWKIAAKRALKYGGMKCTYFAKALKLVYKTIVCHFAKLYSLDGGRATKRLLTGTLKAKTIKCKALALEPRTKANKSDLKRLLIEIENCKYQLKALGA